MFGGGFGGFGGGGFRGGYGGFGGGYGGRRGRGYGRSGWGDTPEFRGRDDIDPRSIAIMAQSNNWTIYDALPTMADGSPVDIAGGPFAPGKWAAYPPIVAGIAGRWAFLAFTVSAQTRGGNMQAYAVTLMTMPGPLPYVHIYPETWRATATSVTQEVNLEYGEFNDRYAVFSKSPETVYSVLSPRTMQQLLELPPLDEIWTAGPNLCLARIDPHNIDTLDAHLRILTHAAGDMPSSAWEPRG